MKRKTIALKSIYVSILILFFQGLLSFIRVRVIIDSFGVETNSLTQSANEVFTYLMILESGLGAAYLYKMYFPYANKDYSKVYSLFLGLKEQLKKIGFLMFTVAFLVSLIYPFLISRNEISYLRSFSILLILGCRFVYPYYSFVAKKSLIAVQEKQYLVTLIDGLVHISTILLEILFILYADLPFEIILLGGLLLLIINNNIYSYLVNKYFNNDKYSNTLPSYEGNEMTKDVLIHHIAGMINSHVDIFVLSLVNLPAVTIYASYNAILNYPINLIQKIMNNLRASIGLKLSAKDKNTYEVFRELCTINLFIASIIIPIFFITVNDFVTLWIGSEFTLSYISVTLFSFVLFHRLNIYLIYIIRDGKGLYKESKLFTLLTAFANLILSIVLVQFYSINGLLIATVLSSFFILDIGNLKLVYNTIFNKSIIVPLVDYVTQIIFIIFVSLLLAYLNQIFIIFNDGNWIQFIQKVSIVSFLTVIINVLFFYSCKPYFKKFLARFFS